MSAPIVFWKNDVGRFRHGSASGVQRAHRADLLEGGEMSEGQDEHVRSEEDHVRSADEEPDVEAHRFDAGRADAGRADAGRADAGRADAGMESETDRNEP